MQLRPNALSAHLTKQVAPVYLLYGNESFLVQESAKCIVAKLSTGTHLEKFSFTENECDKILSEIEQPSLFTSLKVIEITVNKLNNTFTNLLSRVFQKIPEGCFLIIYMSMLTRAQQQTAWFKAILEQGVVVPHWPLKGAEFSEWVETMAKRKGVSLPPAFKQQLLALTEGNYLACAQELDRLRLTGEDTYLGAQSQYEVHELIDAALSKNPVRVIKIISYLKNTKDTLPLVIWSLGQTLRALNRCRGAPKEQHSAILGRAGIRAMSQPLHLGALREAPKTHWLSLLGCLFAADKELKSGQVKSAWQRVLNISLQLANVPVFL